MTFLFSCLKALPFLFPFIKELFSSSTEERTKSCVRSALVFGTLGIAVVIFGQQAYKLHLAQSAELATLRLQYKEVESKNKLLEDRMHENMDRFQKRHAEFNALSLKYDSLQRDYGKLHLEYTQMLRLTVSRNGKFTDKEIETIIEGKKDLDQSTNSPVCYFDDYQRLPGEKQAKEQEQNEQGEGTTKENKSTP